MAHLARLRSASPDRQVGAAIADSKGRLLSMGANEVPKAGGGQYWPGDPEDGRDYAYSTIDVSDKMRKNLLGDLIYRIDRAGLLVKKCPPLDKLLAKDSSVKSSESIRESLLFRYYRLHTRRTRRGFRHIEPSCSRHRIRDDSICHHISMS
jgi:cytidine deaminase